MASDHELKMEVARAFLETTYRIAAAALRFAATEEGQAILQQQGIEECADAFVRYHHKIQPES